MSPALDKISRDFRSAILGGEFIRAGKLASEYSRAVAELWEAIPPQERAVSTIPSQSRELLAWARGMAVIQRTMTAAQLTVVQKARRYNAARSAEAPRPAVQVSA